MERLPDILFVALGVKDNHIVAYGAFRDAVKAIEALHKQDVTAFNIVQLLENVDMTVNVFHIKGIVDTDPTTMLD